MYYIRPKKLGSRGDTIVEVMIVLAVLGMAISISYATANRSLLNARQAQENSEATAILQSQIEALRTLAPNGTFPAGHNIFMPGGVSYCINTPLPPAPYKVVVASDANHALICNKQSGLYDISITYSPALSTDTFTAIASWPDVAGQGTDSVTLTYRAHQ